MVRIVGSHPTDTGSIPVCGISIKFFFFTATEFQFSHRPNGLVDFLPRKKFTFIVTTIEAAIAQLGERQTEDLKVPGSIPGGGIKIFFFVSFTH